MNFRAQNQLFVPILRYLQRIFFKEDNFFFMKRLGSCYLIKALLFGPTEKSDVESSGIYSLGFFIL